MSVDLLTKELITVLGNPSSAQIDEWRSNLYVEGDDILPLWFILANGDVSKSMLHTVKVNMIVRREYWNIMRNSSTTDLIKYINATNDPFNVKELSLRFDVELLTTDQFKGPHKESNTNSYYFYVVSSIMNSEARYYKYNDIIARIKSYFDIKPKPNHTTELRSYLRDDILLNIYFRKELDIDYLPGEEEDIIDVSEYIIAEGWSVQRVITQIIHTYDDNRNQLIYFLNKYGNRISMSKINYYIEKNEIDTTDSVWNDIILNQV